MNSDPGTHVCRNCGIKFSAKQKLSDHMLPCQLANLGKARGFNSVYTQRHLRQQARGPKNKRTRSLKPTVPDGTKRISYIHKKQKLQESKQSSSEDSFTGPMSEPATYTKPILCTHKKQKLHESEQSSSEDSFTGPMSEPVNYFRGQEDLVDTDNEAGAETYLLCHDDLIDTENEAPACSVQAEATYTRE